MNTKLHDGQIAEINELWKDTPISVLRLAKMFCVSDGVMRWFLDRNNFREKQTQRVAKIYKKFPKESRVRRETYRAILDGRLKRKPCIVCGDTNVDAHHEDYSKPLKVIWLCRTHHKKIHKNNSFNKWK